MKSRPGPRSSPSHARTMGLLAAAALVVAACTATTDAGQIAGNDQLTGVTPPLVTSTEPPASPASPITATPVPTTPPTTAAPTTVTSPATTTTTTAAAATTTTTTTTSTSTSTTVPEPLDVFDAQCVVRVDRPATMEQLAADLPAEVDGIALWAENDFVDASRSGDLLDTCPNNGVNDIDGTPKSVVAGAALTSALAANVERQQAKLNELFAGLGTGDLVVDGVPGPRTGQRLCAARLALGLKTTIADMSPGTGEQAALFAASELPTPESSATISERWVLIDRTCQIMFIGVADATTFVFTTSTGSEGFETRDQDRADAFRFNPAVDNGGWHNSSEFPVGIDNPLNGNLYKPLYFDLGQAIHGANNVPPTPQSKGCARLRVGDQETLLAWLGLDDVQTELWRKDEMNVTVNVQGDFVSRDQANA